MKKIKFAAIIPARKGSKRLPNKNIMELAGKPLLQYSINAARKSKFIEYIFISTDIPEDLLINTDTTQCHILKRPDHLTGDNTLMSQVIMDNIFNIRSQYKVDPEYLVLLQPTSPLRTEEDIDKACKLIRDSSHYLSLISVFEPSTHPNKMFLIEDNNVLEPLYNKKDLEKPRQLLPKVYAQNGAIYIMNTVDFEKHQDFYIKPCLPYEMQPNRSIDIDTINDFELAAWHLKKIQDQH